MSHEKAGGEAGERIPKPIQRRLRMLSGYSGDVGAPAAHRLDYAPVPLYLYVTSRVESRSRVHSCAKEPWTVEWIEEHARPGDVVYDIGANVGAYALIAATRVAPLGRVVAVEPGYASYAHLCDNAVLNGLQDVIIPVPLAVGRTTGTGPFHYHRLQPGHARHGLGRTPAFDEPPVATNTALAMTLDDAMAVFGLPAPNLVKLDVDGTENDVLAGAQRALSSPGCRTLIMEVEVANTDDVIATLGGFGLRLQRRHQRERDGQPVGWWYGIFVRS